MKRIKWLAACCLDFLSKDICWASLVIWAQSNDSFFNIFDADKFKQICRTSNQDTPYAYCGKCQENRNYERTHQ